MASTELSTGLDGLLRNTIKKTVLTALIATCVALTACGGGGALAPQ